MLAAMSAQKADAAVPTTHCDWQSEWPNMIVKNTFLDIAPSAQEGDARRRSSVPACFALALFSKELPAPGAAQTNGSSAGAPVQAPREIAYAVLSNIPSRTKQPDLWRAIEAGGFAGEVISFTFPSRVNARGRTLNFGYAHVELADQGAYERFAAALSGFQFENRQGSAKVICVAFVHAGEPMHQTNPVGATVDAAFEHSCCQGLQLQCANLAVAAALPAQVAAAPAGKLWADIADDDQHDEDWWSGLLNGFTSEEEQDMTACKNRKVSPSAEEQPLEDVHVGYVTVF